MRKLFKKFWPWLIPLILVADIALLTFALELISEPSDFAVIAGVLILPTILFLNFKFIQTVK